MNEEVDLLRKPIIAGNWKMNNTISQSEVLISEILQFKLDESVEAVICTPFTSLERAKKLTESSGIRVGAQNLHWEEKGAYTGEISPLMLNELNVDYVIIGHSERRQYFGESDETVNKKIISALDHGLIPIVCVGETLSQRENNIHHEVIKEQTIKALDGISKDELKKLVIAYEPIWAIGTGITASSEQAQEMCEHIRKTLESQSGDETAQSVRILYGGSVKPDNVVELMNMKDIDGALVGGASLKATDFERLVNYKMEDF